MSKALPFRVLEDASQLASFMGWSQEVYEDLSEIREGRLSEAEFRDKYAYERAILSLDMTDFTLRAMLDGEMQSLLRILDAQKVCAPVLQEFNAELIRFFADDIVAVFESPSASSSTQSAAPDLIQRSW